MADVLPTTIYRWKKATNREAIPAGLLSSGHAFQSGSNFSDKDFLRLRILHKSFRAAQLFTAHLSKASVKEMSQTFDNSQDIQVLRDLLPTWRNIEEWTNDSSRKAGQFAVGLEHLSIITTPASDDGSQMMSSQGSVSSRIINSPRIRKPGYEVAKDNTSLTDHLSRLNLEPKTPSKSSGLPLDDWTTPASFPSASTAPALLSPITDDLQKAIDTWDREMFELTGDEQTVNACLVALIIPIASMLGSRGRVRLDRRPFQVLKKNATDGKALYEAQVDGIIMNKDGKDVETFMEVKRELRARKKEVRMQEGAQMAAFIYSKGRTTEAKR